MNSSRQFLKTKLEAGEVLFGSWSQMDTPEAVEMIGSAGFDFAVIDMEHGHFGLELIANMLRAADSFGISPLVRVMDGSSSVMLKVLDMGAEGIIVPGISSAEDAKKAALSVRYAPHGERGACPTIRAAGHLSSDWPAFAMQSNRDVMLCLLVEGKRGAENFEDIVKVPGIDAVMIGPFDLSVSLGVGGQLKHPMVVAKIEQMAQIAKANGVYLACNVFDFEPEEIRKDASRWISLGARLVMIGGDKFFLMPSLLRARAAVKGLSTKI